MGLPGFFTSRTSLSPTCPPNRYGMDDIPLILQDRAFDDDGNFYTTIACSNHARFARGYGSS